MTPLASLARSVLSPIPEVSRLSSLRRCTSLFSQSQVADSLYLIEDGLVKLTRTNGSPSRIILGIFGPGDVVGEEVLGGGETPVYYADAETLTAAVVMRVPHQTLVHTLAAQQDFSAALTSAIIQQKIMLAEKVELLCLHDVEYRILHYLAQLSSLVKPLADGEGYQLPITQLELADLIGATRETTSTTLNQLERRGLVRLSRRLLTIPSPGVLRNAALARTNHHQPEAAATAVASA
jgi:CRP-like cAMP-binding protein